MQQISQPVSDVTNATWTPTPVWQQVNELVPDDTRYVTSSGSDSGDGFEVGLSTVNLPSAGPQTLRLRLKELSAGSGSGSSSGSGAGGGPVWVQIDLRQGTVGGVQTIASTVALPGSTFSEFDLVLTSAQAAAIAYDGSGLAQGLRARVTTLPPITVGCCPNPLPAVLTGTFANGAGGCQCLNGVTVRFIYQGTGVTYTGVLGNVSCGQSPFSTFVSLICSSVSWHLAMDACVPGNFTPTSANCSPIELRFIGLPGGLGCCTGGTVDFVITE